MKIVLIEPRAPGLHIFSRFPIPRLGPVILATQAQQRGWEAEVIFEETHSLNLHKLPQADIAGISTITSTATRAYKLADAYRKQGTPVIMGGPHVTFMPDEALEHADFVVRGEGEVPFEAFMEAFESGGGWESIPSLSYKSGSKAVHNPMCDIPVDLEEIPSPDMSLLQAPKSPRKPRIVPIETSRGCPYHCEFCSVHRIFGRRMRYRPIDELLTTLREHVTPRDLIFFVDDNFAANPAHTKKLLRAILDSGLKLNWTAQMRADAARDPELLDLMQRSGCSAIYTGIESVNDATLKNIKKKQTIGDMARDVAAFLKHKVKVHGMFILGFDGDDKAAAARTVRWAKQVKISSVQFLVLTPLPGTATFDQMQAENRILTMDWQYYDAHHVVFKPTSVMPVELQMMQIRAHRKFYSLTRQIRHLLTFNIWEMVVAIYASNINVRWKRLNRYYVRWLKSLSESIKANFPMPDSA